MNVLSFAFVGVYAWAQGATPAPLSKVTVSNEVAKRTLMKMQINAETAKAIADSCVEFSKTSTPPQSISIFILGPTGDIVHAHEHFARAAGQRRQGAHDAAGG